MTFTLLKCRTVRHVFIVKFEQTNTSHLLGCDAEFHVILGFGVLQLLFSNKSLSKFSRHISPWDVDFWIAEIPPHLSQ